MRGPACPTSALRTNEDDRYARIVAERRYTARAVLAFWPANADGDSIEVYADEARTAVIAGVGVVGMDDPSSGENSLLGNALMLISSVATAATIGTVALPSLRRHGYPMREALGSLAAGGTLTQIVQTGAASPLKITAAQLAAEVEHVVTIEESAGAGVDALENLGAFTNVTRVVGKVEETLPGMTPAPDVVIIDPPRAGIDEATLKLVAQFEHVIYISCNPETLRANLDILVQSHDIMRTALFDQFPFTHHIESGVLLKKRR